MQFEIEAASVADRFAVIVPSPEGGSSGAAVCATEAQATGGSLKVDCMLWGWMREIRIF